MKVTRMFEIIYLLLEHKQLTTVELAAHLEVSKRTILRDIEALAMAGIPIYTTKGRGGGITLVDTYVLNKRLLSKEEQQQILFGLQTLTVTSDIFSIQTLKKMRTLFASDELDWLLVDVSRWGRLAAESADLFQTIKQAILRERILTYWYTNSSGRASRKKVYPLKLVFKATAWYLQAYCTVNHQVKTYKLCRIYNARVEAVSFCRQDYEIPLLDAFKFSDSSLIEVTILFSKEASFRAYDEFTAEVIERNADGSVLVSTRLPEDQWLYSFLLSLGGQAKVIAPKAVQEKLVQQMKAAREMYSF